MAHVGPIRSWIRKQQPESQQKHSTVWSGIASIIAPLISYIHGRTQRSTHATFLQHPQTHTESLQHAGQYDYLLLADLTINKEVNLFAFFALKAMKDALAGKQVFLQGTEVR